MSAKADDVHKEESQINVRKYGFTAGSQNY
jgi:hypothetical protein